MCVFHSFLIQRLIGNVITLFVAGADTTAILMAWMFKFIAEDAELQARLKKEADAYDFDALKEPGSRFDEVLEKLPLFHAVVLETLRTNGAVSDMMLVNSERVTVLGKEFAPGTTFLLLYEYAMTTVHGGAEEFFGKEPEKFNADRWLEADRIKSAAGLLSFGNGARICPGKDLAKIEAVVCVGMVLKKFKSMRLEEGHAEVKKIHRAVIAPDRDIRVVFE